MFTSSFKNFLRGLAVFAVLVIVFETMVSLIPDEIGADVVLLGGMKIKNERALNPGDLDVVILGDCFFFGGVNPNVLDPILNVRSFNFAVTRAHSYMMSFVLLEDILSRAKRPPRLIILGVHATSLYHPLTMDIDVLRETILPFSGVSSNLLNELPVPLKMQTLWHDALTRIPSIRKQYLLRGHWPYLMTHFDRARYMRIKQSLAENRGYFNEDLLGFRQTLRVNFNLPAEDTTIRAYNDRYIRKILARAAKSGIKVVLVTNSYRKDLAEHLNYNIMFDVSYFETLKNSYPGVIGILDMHHVVSDPERYVDTTHLDNKGAAIFTSELAERIRQLDW